MHARESANLRSLRWFPVSQSKQRFRLLTVAGGRDRVGVENEEEELARAFRNNALSNARRTCAPRNQRALDRPLNDTNPDADPEHHDRSDPVRFHRAQCVRHEHRHESRSAHRESSNDRPHLDQPQSLRPPGSPVASRAVGSTAKRAAAHSGWPRSWTAPEERRPFTVCRT